MILVFSALLFSLSSNLDNVVIGIAYGIKKIRIGFGANLIIAFVTSIGTFLSMSAGKYISRFLPTYVANALGAIIIIVLGVYFLFTSAIKLAKDASSKELALKNITEMLEYAQKSDTDNSGDISMKESLIVAFGLTFNNVGTGIAASITGVDIRITSIATFMLSLITILFGESIGNHVLGNFFGKYAPLISGILLTILGFFELFN